MKTALNGISEPYKVLEEKFSKFDGSKYGVTCSSGTAALHLALVSLGIGPGDEVIVPNFTMAAVAFAVSYTGAKPIFCEIEEFHLGLDWGKVSDKITKKTKAIILVHTYGLKAMHSKQIFELARKANIPVIEDACEAQGSIQKSKALMTCYSFFKNKIIAAEEGGMITTNSLKLKNKLDYLKNMAFGEKHDYFHKDIGFNYRMANSQAKLALKSLANYPRNSKKRRQIEIWYNHYLPPEVIFWKRRNTVWFYHILLPISIDKEILLKAIPKARNAFKPLSSFPMYGGVSGISPSSYYSDKILLLPTHPSITKKEVIKISKIIKESLIYL